MTAETSTMHIDLRTGESIQIGGAIITLMEKSGLKARLTVAAPRNMRVVPPRKNNPSAHECAPLPVAKE